MKSRFFTTEQVAKRAGVSRQTLYSWMAAGVVEAPEEVRPGVRLWTEKDIQRVAGCKGTLRMGRPTNKKKGGAK
jgi:DNA-binding transcriptional MerR regulator